MQIIPGTLNLVIFSLLMNNATASSSSFISSSTSRLPMSLSSVITDLEAEGVAQLSTATILTSRSVSSSDRLSLYQKLFGEIDDDVMDDDVENVSLDQATAFGKQFGQEDEEKVGIAIANPSASSSGSGAEAAMTVLSTHGSIIYICHPVDLQREEGLFWDLAPAVERLLMQRDRSSLDDVSSDGESDLKENKKAELIVIFQGMDSSDPSALSQAKKKFERAAASMLSTIVKPTSTSSSDKNKIQDVFETVEYLSESSASSSSGLFRTLMEGEGQLMEPADAAASVASAVAYGVGDAGIGRLTSQLTAVDLAVGRKLVPISRKALQSTLSRIREVTSINEEVSSDDPSSSTKLVSNFGDLVDASISQTMAEFDEAISSSTAFKRSPITKRKRSDLLDQIYEEVGDIYDAQLTQLKTACFESFRKGLSKLRVSPTLPQDMQNVASDAIKQFQKQSKLLLPTSSKNDAKTHTSFWSSSANAKYQFQRSLKEYCTDRLNAAKASGSYRPLPRKGVTVGLHWLLPKPFGNDYRQNPSDVYSGSQLVYSPRANKLAEIGEEEVAKGTGDWRKHIIPVPAGSEMMYQPEKNE